MSVNSPVTRKNSAQVLVSSIKGEVKKKHISFGRKFSCFSAQLFEQDLFWPAAPYARLLGTAQGYWFSLPAVFIAFRDEACQFPKPTKQKRRS
jgi:hypothetical protein